MRGQSTSFPALDVKKNILDKLNGILASTKSSAVKSNLNGNISRIQGYLNRYSFNHI